MASSTLTIRIDEDLKREASEVADYYGLDLSSVTRAFYKQMVNTRRIPSPSPPKSQTPRALRRFARAMPSSLPAKRVATITVRILSQRRCTDGEVDGGILRRVLARPQKEGPLSQLGSRRTPEPHRSCSRELARVHGDSSAPAQYAPAFGKLGGQERMPCCELGRLACYLVVK